MLSERKSSCNCYKWMVSWWPLLHDSNNCATTSSRQWVSQLLNLNWWILHVWQPLLAPYIEVFVGLYFLLQMNLHWIYSWFGSWWRLFIFFWTRFKVFIYDGTLHYEKKYEKLYQVCSALNMALVISSLHSLMSFSMLLMQTYFQALVLTVFVLVCFLGWMAPCFNWSLSRPTPVSWGP